MKGIKNFLFYLCIFLVPWGIWNRTQDAGGSEALILGLLGLAIYFFARTIMDLIKERSSKMVLSFQVIIILMSVILFTRYLYWKFGDYPGLIIIPAFIIMAWFYLKTIRPLDTKLVTITILYLILTIPLFALNFHKDPRRYFPKEWYNRYETSGSISITLPYEYQYQETLQICEQARLFKNSRNYDDAVRLYREARKLEPQNPRILFELSCIYSNSNELETAISLLDTAIILDSNSAIFYSNRGLLNYKLKNNNLAILDYLNAIKIEPKRHYYHTNLALVYYYEDEFEKACESISKSEELGYENLDNTIEFIKKRYCQ